MTKYRIEITEPLVQPGLCITVEVSSKDFIEALEDLLMSVHEFNERQVALACCEAHQGMKVYIEPRDIWVGVYVGPDAVYVCPLPMLVFKFNRRPKVECGEACDGALRWLDAASCPECARPLVYDLTGIMVKCLGCSFTCSVAEMRYRNVGGCACGAGVKE